MLPPSPDKTPRRRWLAVCLAGLPVLPRRLDAQGRGACRPTSDAAPGHPGSQGVATRRMLDGDADPTALFDAEREIPRVVDGIRCHCGCADLEGYYSLLTCYEGAEAMAKICQGEGRVGARMAKAGRSLDDIRTAIDAPFG